MVTENAPFHPSGPLGTDPCLEDLELIPWLGICLRERRERAKLSQACLARKSLVSRSALIKIERGQKTGGTLAIVIRLCHGLGIHLGELVTEATRRWMQHLKSRELGHP